MKTAAKVLTVGATVTVLTSVVRWNYVVDLLHMSTDAASSLVQEGNVSETFRQEIDSLSVEKFIDITFFENWIQENNESETVWEDELEQ